MLDLIRIGLFTGLIACALILLPHAHFHVDMRNEALDMSAFKNAPFRTLKSFVTSYGTDRPGPQNHHISL